MNEATPAIALRTAAFHGEAGLIRNLLREGVDPNVADQWGRTALTLAAGEGRVSAVDLLLAGGAWVDPHEDYDVHETPLIAAAARGHLEVVKRLVNAGANLGYYGGVAQMTAQAHARHNGHIVVAEYLGSLRP